MILLASFPAGDEQGHLLYVSFFLVRNRSRFRRAWSQNPRRRGVIFSTESRDLIFSILSNRLGVPISGLMSHQSSQASGRSLSSIVSSGILSWNSGASHFLVSSYII